METGQSKFGALQIGIVLLTLATAGIHFSLVFPSAMFILNALGYLTLLAAYFLPLPFAKDNRNLVRWAFIAYTAVTILGWVVIGDKNTAKEFITKAIEVLLIALLWYDGRQ